jgi:lipopolysaccharide export system permease protein
MSNQNELAAIKASGVSLYRFMLPFLAVALVLSVSLVYFGGYVVPDANQAKVQLQQTYMKKNMSRSSSDIYFQDSENRIVTIRYYDIKRMQANRVSIQEFDKANPTRLVKRLDADRMRFDTTSGSWKMLTGTKREFEGNKKVAEEDFNALEIKRLNFQPKDVIRKQRKPEEMTLQELKQFANDQRRAGNDPARVLIEYHSRIAFAFTCFVVVLLGMPISANRRHGGLAIQFGISFIFTFLYLVFMKISQAFGKNGLMHPMLTAWLANLIFFATAIINLIRVRK